MALIAGCRTTATRAERRVPALTAGLVGRTKECGLIDRLLGDAKADRAASWSYTGIRVSGRARSSSTQSRRLQFRVASVTGVQSEMEVPFAAVHKLCTRMFDRRRRHLVGGQPPERRSRHRCARGGSSPGRRPIGHLPHARRAGGLQASRLTTSTSPPVTSACGSERCITPTTSSAPPP
jgi:hypothetical protein